MRTLWKRRVEIPRSLDTLTLHEAGYWSGNKVLFNGQMPQDRQDTYVGPVAIVDFPVRKLIINLKNAGSMVKENSVNILLGGLIEALWVGTHYPDMVVGLDGFLAPGSLASPGGVDDWFCPYIFKFGHKISAGIELLEWEKKELYVKARTKLLVLANV